MGSTYTGQSADSRLDEGEHDVNPESNTMHTKMSVRVVDIRAF